MTKKSNKVDMLQRYSPIISMASAIIAAALTAFVSFKVASVESDTQRLVASLEAETQKLVATLKTETEKTIGFSMHNIKKAELFHSLISELKNEEKGSLALLVLWRLYSDIEERKTTIVAAFEVKQPEIIRSLIRLEEKENWEPYIATIQRLVNSEDQDIAKAAREFWGSMNTVQAGQYHIDHIVRNEDMDALSESVTSLIELAKNNSSVKELILEASKASNGRKAIFAYTLYKADAKKPFNSLLTEKARDPNNFKDFRRVFGCGYFEPEERVLIANFATNYLRQNFGENRGLDSLALTVLVENYGPNIQMKNEDKEFLLTKSKAVFLDPNENETIRFRALIALKTIDARQSLLAISELMAYGDAEMSLRVSMDEVLIGSRSGDPLIGDGLKVLFEKYDIPDIEADKSDWKEFFSEIQSENEA